MSRIRETWAQIPRSLRAITNIILIILFIYINILLCFVASKKNF